MYVFVCGCVWMCIYVQDLVSLVVGGLEREGVRMMRECEPREVKREGETGGLEVHWYNKNTGETEQVGIMVHIQVNEKFFKLESGI